MSFYKVLRPLHHENRKYLAGEIVELPDGFSTLDVLLQQRVIEPTSPPNPLPANLAPAPVPTPVSNPPKKKDDSSPTA